MPPRGWAAEPLAIEHSPPGRGWAPRTTQPRSGQAASAATERRDHCRVHIVHVLYVAMTVYHDLPPTGLVWRLSMRWRSAIDRAIAPLGLTHAQYAVLAPLLGMDRAGHRPSQRQLADATGLEPLYVSKLARVLERAGLLERTGNPHDTRAVQVTLTPRGRDVATRAVKQVLELQDELTAPLGGLRDPKTQALLESLRTLLNPPAPADESTLAPPARRRPVGGDR